MLCFVFISAYVQIVVINHRGASDELLFNVTIVKSLENKRTELKKLYYQNTQDKYAYNSESADENCHIVIQIRKSDRNR